MRAFRLRDPPLARAFPLGQCQVDLRLSQFSGGSVIINLICRHFPNTLYHWGAFTFLERALLAGWDKMTPQL